MGNCSLQSRPSTAKLCLEGARSRFADPISKSQNDIRPAVPSFQTRFDPLVDLQYFAVFCSPGVFFKRLYTPEQLPVPLFEFQHAASGLPAECSRELRAALGIGTIRSTCNSRMREREGEDLGRRRLGAQERTCRMRLEGSDRATSESSLILRVRSSLKALEFQMVVHTTPG